jgi:hypothetical protein
MGSYWVQTMHLVAWPHTMDIATQDSPQGECACILVERKKIRREENGFIPNTEGKLG